MSYVVVTILIAYIWTKIKTANLEEANERLTIELEVVTSKREEEREKYLNRIYTLNSLLDKEYDV